MPLCQIGVSATAGAPKSPASTPQFPRNQQRRAIGPRPEDLQLHLSDECLTPRKMFFFGTVLTKATAADSKPEFPHVP